MATINDITVPSNDWISVNNTSGIAVGTAFDLQVKSSTGILLREDTVKPNATDNNGRVVSSLRYNYAVATIEAGSEEVWAKCIDSGKTALINVGLI